MDNNHDRLVYLIAEGAEMLSLDDRTFLSLVNEHGLGTYTIKRKRFLPGHEIDRLVTILIRKQRRQEVEHGAAA